MERGEREAYAAVVGPGSCLSAVAFRGHGRGPIEGGLCPHKWLPGSAVAHLPLIPTPGLTFASSFLSSPLPLIPSPFPLSLLSLSLSLSPPMRIYPPLPPSNPQTILHRISLSLSLSFSFSLRSLFHSLPLLLLEDPLSPRTTTAHVCTTGPL